MACWRIRQESMASLFQPRTDTTITTNEEEVGDLLAV
jgi:hypothetical protein